jgi:membrane fusion protein (multidrug efflux system)
LDDLLAGPSAAQQRAANSSVTVAAANLKIAEAQLDLLLAGATPEQIRQAQVGVEEAEVAAESARVAVELAEAAVARARAGVVSAQAAVDTTQAALDRLTLAAVFDGTVADIAVEQGEVVSSNAPVITVADFSGWLVETSDLTELDVVEVSEGLPASIRLDAIPEEDLSGTVTDIALVAVQSRGDIVYEVVIRLDETDRLPLRWGMTALVDIETD